MKRNIQKNKKNKISPLASTQERLTHFQTKHPHQFRRVFENYQKGQRELKEGLIHQAKASFDTSLGIYSEYIPALNHLAVALGILHNYKDALSYVKKVLNLDDKNVLALIQGAVFLYRLDRENEAGNYAQKALVSFHEREGHDSYHDYDMLQKLVEMLSVLRLDRLLVKLYRQREKQLSPISLYRAALALSNESLFEDASLAFQSIRGHQIEEKAELLHKNLQLFQKEGLYVPKLLPEDENGFEQLMSVFYIYNGDEKQKHQAIEQLRKTENSWSVDVIKAMLRSRKLEDWLKKSLLSVLADWGQAKNPVTVILNDVEQAISIQPMVLEINEKLTEIFTKAKAALAKGEFNNAIELLQEVRIGSPLFIPVYIELVNAYLALTMYKEAKQITEEALKIAPIAPVLFAAAKCNLAVDEKAEALDFLQRFDTREMEELEDVKSAIKLKVTLMTEVSGKKAASKILQEEKQKFQTIIPNWKTFEQELEKILQVDEVIYNDEKERNQPENIVRLLDSYKKEKLVSIVKYYKIRGYSKLNKKDLIDLASKEIYVTKQWKSMLTEDERLVYDALVKYGTSVSKKDIINSFPEEMKLFLEEINSTMPIEEMKSRLSKLMSKGVLFVENNEKEELKFHFIE